MCPILRKNIFQKFKNHLVVFLPFHCISDYIQQSDLIGTNNTGHHNAYTSSFGPGPSQISSDQINTPYQFFNGSEHQPSQTSNISNQPGVDPFYTIQQQSNQVNAESNDVSQTMSYVSQGKEQDVTLFVIINKSCILYVMLPIGIFLLQANSFCLSHFLFWTKIYMWEELFQLINLHLQLLGLYIDV